MWVWGHWGMSSSPYEGSRWMREHSENLTWPACSHTGPGPRSRVNGGAGEKMGRLPDYVTCELWVDGPAPYCFFKEIRNSYFSWREVGKRVVERQVGCGGILRAYATPLGALMACLTQSVEGWIEQKGGASQESEGTAPAWLLWAGTSIFFSAFELERKQSLLASWPFQPLA